MKNGKRILPLIGRHGYWKKHFELYMCSACGELNTFNTKRCPICKAKMDLTQKD